jgi:hypothetical protein
MNIVEAEDERPRCPEFYRRHYPHTSKPGGSWRQLTSSRVMLSEHHPRRQRTFTQAFQGIVGFLRAQSELVWARGGI